MDQIEPNSHIFNLQTVPELSKEAQIALAFFGSFLLSAVLTTTLNHMTTVVVSSKGLAPLVQIIACIALTILGVFAMRSIKNAILEHLPILPHQLPGQANNQDSNDFPDMGGMMPKGINPEHIHTITEEVIKWSNATEDPTHADRLIKIAQALMQIRKAVEQEQNAKEMQMEMFMKQFGGNDFDTNEDTEISANIDNPINFEVFENKIETLLGTLLDNCGVTNPTSNDHNLVNTVIHEDDELD